MVKVRLVWNNGEITDEEIAGTYRPLYIFKAVLGKAIRMIEPTEEEMLRPVPVEEIKFIYQGESLGRHVYIQVVEKEN